MPLSEKWILADETKLMDSNTQITVSVVSHNQAPLVLKLLDDLNTFCRSNIEFILTLNTDEYFPTNENPYYFPLTIINNQSRKGFGSNHNAAFKQAFGKYFCVLNPDIRLSCDPFPELIGCLTGTKASIAAPLIVNDRGEIEDSARKFPTPFQIVTKALFGKRTSEYWTKSMDSSPDWVGGMFMLIPAKRYREIGGFDERYFLYYEDVDLCARMRLAGYEIRLCPNAKVTHEARRQSHRDFRYLRWHLASMLRFFFSKPFLMIMWRRRKNGKP